jgi:hypothetical protein
LLDWHRLPDMRAVGLVAVEEAIAVSGETVERIRAMCR